MSSQKQPNRKPPFAFARFEHCPNGGTKIKNCYLSNKDIQPNEISYKIRFRDYNDSKDYFISEEVAQKTPEFMTCIKMYNENMFPPELLFDTPLVAKNTSYYDYVIDKFRLQEYLKDNLWKDVIQSLKIIDKDKTVVDDINQSFVAICGFICSSLHIDLLKFWDMISPELQLTLALSDNQKFRLKAYETGLLKDFKPIYELLSKNKQSVKDMLFLANWGKGNQDSLKLLQKADLPDIKFHALRHTFSTRALEVGMDYKTLSEILGHSSVGITLDLYAHSLNEHKRNEMNKLGRIFDK